ncbi:MAG: bifunctional methylenetetrahydrofolate dehydrogenase/methenyltetrahydrofolate cyclohydrolase FolD [Desulfovibrio sp.]|nr:bifunctional methylenetetrahydrofolate dehydrogenase/methenyltetrahydrofolate cyclohydrolase FolD [Desulfovibrio sp.]
MRILDGKKIAADLRAEARDEIRDGVARGIRPPGLAVILAGDDPASQIYVRNKRKACEEIGVVSHPFILPNDVSEAEVLKLIAELNARDDIDGILLQLPLPEGIDSRKCLLAIDPEKDADGFHPVNMGNLALGLPCLAPCTPAGVMELLERSGLSVKGKKAVIVGRSDIVGKPLAMMLSRKNVDATVTICHSGTPNLEDECRGADFLFLAMGRPEAIVGDMVKDGCVVIDVGINRTPDGLRGDAHFESVSGKASAITPVPGGVGPMTIAALMKNAVRAWKKRTGQDTLS